MAETQKVVKQTGTQKKAVKQSAHEYRKAAPTRKKATKKIESYLHGGGRYEKTKRNLEDIRQKEKKGAPSTSKLAESLRHGPAYNKDETFKDMRAFRFGGKGLKEREKFKELEPFKPGGSAYKGQENFGSLRKYELGGDAFNDQENFRSLDPFKLGGKAHQKVDFAKDSRQGLKLANEALAPIQQQTLRQYGQNTIPGLINSLGADSKKSSALNQALSTARNNLAENLNAQTAGLAIGYGGDISRMNLGERARQSEQQYGAALNQSQLRNQQEQNNLGIQSNMAQYRTGQLSNQQLQNLGIQSNVALNKTGMSADQIARQQALAQQNAVQGAQLNIGQQAGNKQLQYQTAADIFNAQNAQNQGYANQKRQDVQYMNNLNLGAANQLQNAGVQGANIGFQPNYTQGQASPSIGQRIGGSIAQGAQGGAAGFLLGGPVGAAVGGIGGGLAGLFKP